jgi:peptide/nickel transport system permease protein
MSGPEPGRRRAPIGGISAIPEIDKTIADILGEFDTTKRLALLTKLNEQMNETAVMIFVVHDVNPRALSPKVHGFIQAQSWFQDLTPVTVSPMIFYILRRILYAIPIAFGVSIVCFSLVYIAPGDPLQTVMPPDATAETIEIVKHAYGFDKPIPVQYLIWLGHVLTGDLGMSISTRRPVILEVTDALSNTALLGALRGAALVLYRLHDGRDRRVFPGALARPLGDRHRRRRCQPAELLARHRAGGVVRGRILAVAGDRHGAERLDQFHIFEWSSARYLVLPVFTLAMIPIGILARTTRAAVAEVRNQDFVQTLRAKGLSEWAVIRHVLKNSLPQVMAVMGLQFGYLLGGSILVETVFTWPGSGFLLSKAIINRDVPVLQGTILTLSLIFVATNLIVDLLQSLVDPRIRRA